MMKKFALLQLPLLCLLLTLSSCSSSDEPEMNVVGPVERYSYEIKDSVLSADSHEFTLAMTGEDCPKDWQAMDFRVWEGESVPETIGPAIFEWQISYSDEQYFHTGNTLGINWISIEKIPTPTSPEVKISVKNNNTGMARGVWFMFGNEWDNGRGSSVGHLILLQSPD